MVPGRDRRRSKVERGAMRLVATGGIVGIAVILGRAALVLAAALAETVVIRAPRRVRPVAWGHVVFPP
jgi:hypothetical protein